jgi:hypothetical protein
MIKQCLNIILSNGPAGYFPYKNPKYFQEQGFNTVSLQVKPIYYLILKEGGALLMAYAGGASCSGVGFSSTGAILVLFILLVIISRTILY